LYAIGLSRRHKFYIINAVILNSKKKIRKKSFTAKRFFNGLELARRILASLSRRFFGGGFEMNPL
jgi:hypothetical protein